MTVYCAKILTPSDGRSIQKDIGSLLVWPYDWIMDFNADKCKVLKLQEKSCRYHIQNTRKRT